ncbi:EpsG family protein [Shewanella ulleungensis]|uniref:EpsG family protein n=1 Tax=Shewanella ulleungensis TaxID=2282699 RepID=UPI003D79D941
MVINFNRDFFHFGNDLVWYYSYFKNFLDYQPGFLNSFEHDDLANVSIKSSEPLYHFLVYLTSNLSNAYYPFYLFWVHCVIYLVPTFVIINICKIERVSIFICFSLVLFQMLVFYDFGNAYNLIRQQVACSFMVLSFYFMYVRNFKSCILFSLLSVLTHNSTVIIVILIINFCLYNLRYISYKSLVFLAIILSFSYVLAYFSINDNYETLNDKSRGVFVKLIDFSLFLSAFIVVYFIDSKYREIYRFLFIFFIALLLSHISSFLPLRFFTFYDSFKWLVYFILLNFFYSKLSLIKNVDFFMLFISFFLTFFYFNLKIVYTDYTYDGTFVDFVFDSPFYYLDINL